MQGLPDGYLPDMRIPPDFFSSLDFPDTSFSLQDTIPSFFDDLHARPCCSGFELLSDQTVEVALSVVPREPVLACSKEQAEEIGKPPFRGRSSSSTLGGKTAFSKS